jgi:hypothetical protein
MPRKLCFLSGQRILRFDVKLQASSSPNPATKQLVAVWADRAAPPVDALERASWATRGWDPNVWAMIDDVAEAVPQSSSWAADESVGQLRVVVVVSQTACFAPPCTQNGQETCLAARAQWRITAADSDWGVAGRGIGLNHPQAGRRLSRNEEDISTKPKASKRDINALYLADQGLSRCNDA